MSVAQAWLLFGIPSLLLAMTFFIGRSSLRALLGYLSLVGGFIGLALADRASAAAFSALIFFAYAAGRGGTLERLRPGEGDEDETLEHHREVGATGRA